MNDDATQPLPVFAQIAFPVATIATRTRHPRSTASRAVTVRIPVVR